MTIFWQQQLAVNLMPDASRGQVLATGSIGTIHNPKEVCYTGEYRMPIIVDEPNTLARES